MHFDGLFFSTTGFGMLWLGFISDNRPLWISHDVLLGTCYTRNDL